MEYNILYCQDEPIQYIVRNILKYIAIYCDTLIYICIQVILPGTCVCTYKAVLLYVQYIVQHIVQHIAIIVTYNTIYCNIYFRQ